MFDFVFCCCGRRKRCRFKDGTYYRRRYSPHYANDLFCKVRQRTQMTIVSLSLAASFPSLRVVGRHSCFTFNLTLIFSLRLL